MTCSQFGQQRDYYASVGCPGRSTRGELRFLRTAPESQIPRPSGPRGVASTPRGRTITAVCLGPDAARHAAEQDGAERAVAARPRTPKVEVLGDAYERVGRILYERVDLRVDAERLCALTASDRTERGSAGLAAMAGTPGRSCCAPTRASGRPRSSRGSPRRAGATRSACACSHRSARRSSRSGAPVELWVKIRPRGRGSGGQPGDPARGARCGSCATRARRRRAGEAVVAEPRAARQATACRAPSWPRTRRLQEFSSLDPGFGSAGGQVIAGRAGGRRVGEAGTGPRVHPQVERRPADRPERMDDAGGPPADEHCPDRRNRTERDGGWSFAAFAPLIAKASCCRPGSCFRSRPTAPTRSRRSKPSIASTPSSSSHPARLAPAPDRPGRPHQRQQRRPDHRCSNDPETSPRERPRSPPTTTSPALPTIPTPNGRANPPITEHAQLHRWIEAKRGARRRHCRRRRAPANHGRADEGVLGGSREPRA